MIFPTMHMYISSYSKLLKINYCGVFILKIMHIYIMSGSTFSRLCLKDWAFKYVLQFWRMEFLQVPETPAPEPVEPDVPDCCGEEKIGES